MKQFQGVFKKTFSAHPSKKRPFWTCFFVFTFFCVGATHLQAQDNVTAGYNDSGYPLGPGLWPEDSNEKS